MQQNNYNWYSTNSLKRYHRSAVREHPRRTQLSDEGRYPLGSVCDPENMEVRRQLIGSVSEETLQSWEDYRKEWREKSLLKRRMMGIDNEEVDESFRTYPEKKFSMEEYLDNETQAASDASQQSRNEYNRSKYVLNRKTNPIPSTSAHDSPRSTAESSLSDQIFVDDSQPSASNVRWVVSGKENHRDKEVSSTENEHQKSRISTSSLVEKSLRTSNIVKSEKGRTLIVTVPSSACEVQECILHKYGHCFAPSICPYAHDGVVRKTEGKKVVPPVWQRKLPNTTLCPGYPTFQCWNYECENRHIVYPSDDVS